jgi:hypothetical protein
MSVRPFKGHSFPRQARPAADVTYKATAHSEGLLGEPDTGRAREARSAAGRCRPRSSRTMRRGMRQPVGYA